MHSLQQQSEFTDIDTVAAELRQILLVDDLAENQVGRIRSLSQRSARPSSSRVLTV